MIITHCVNAVLNILHIPFMIAIFKVRFICFAMFYFISFAMTLNRD